MNIGIIGAGNIGASAARLFADAGHEVADQQLPRAQGFGVARRRDQDKRSRCNRRRCGFLRRGSAGGDPVLASRVAAGRTPVGQDSRGRDESLCGAGWPDRLRRSHLERAARPASAGRSRCEGVQHNVPRDAADGGATGPVGTASCSSSRATTRRRRPSYRGP